MEPIIEPDLPIIDPHHHLWDRRAILPLLPSPPAHAFENVLWRTPRYLLDELLADMGAGHNVRATVFVECGAYYRADGPAEMKPVGETEFVNGVAAMAASGQYGKVRPCAAIVGHADMMLGDAVAPVLEAHIAAGGGRFRGIRHRGAWDADVAVLGAMGDHTEGVQRTPAFQAGVRALGLHGLSFDAWVLEPQLPDVIALARACPDTSIILDHVGTPLGLGRYAGQREARFAGWAESIRALAGCPNVTVKLGGLAMPFCGFDTLMTDPPAGSERLAADWAPYIETCVAAFGPDRCMFESNFPVDALTCDYATLWNAFKRIAAGWSAADKAAAFAGTAGRVYRIPVN